MLKSKLRTFPLWCDRDRRPRWDYSDRYD